MTRSSWACPQCKKVTLRKSLYTHLRNVHFYTSEEVEKVKDEINRKAPVRRDYVFCPSCEERLGNHERLAKHCEEKHAEEGAGGEPQDYTVFMLSLANKKEFEAWLEEHQQHSGTTFYTRDSSKSSISLRCNRAGKYSKTTQTRATHTKRDVLHCSCFLNVKFEDDGSVNVKGCLGHIGHKVDSALLRLTRTQQLFLKELLEEFSHDEIIKRLRRDYPAETSRLHFVTKGDLWSISYRFGLKPVHCSSDDMPPVNEGTDEEENNTDDGIRLLEMPGNPSGERFRLIIITPEQVQCLQKFSHKGISIRSAQSSILKRVTVMVSNEQDEDIPTAFLLCESMTSLDVEEFFREIRKVVPGFDPKQIHTDDASCFYEPFRSVFPKSRAKLQMANLNAKRSK